MSTSSFTKKAIAPSSQDVIDASFLHFRHQLIEMGAMLDRYEIGKTTSSEVSPAKAAEWQGCIEALQLLIDKSNNNPNQDAAKSVALHFSDK